MKLFHSMTAVFFEDRYFRDRGQEWRDWSDKVLRFHRLHSFAFYYQATPKTKPEKLYEKDAFYLRARDIWKGDSMLDSGAFTLENTGTPISVDKFIDFCKNTTYPWEYIASLDCIGDAKITYANMHKIHAAGITKAFPTYHMNEPSSYLDKYCEECPLIGLGGLVGAPVAVLYKWLKEVFPRIPKKTKVHGFGILATDIITDFPWYSVDSTTTAKAAFYKEVYVGFEGHVPLKLSVGAKKNHNHIRQNKNLLWHLEGKIEEINNRYGTKFTVAMLEDNGQDFIRFIWNKLIYEEGLEAMGIKMDYKEVI